MVRERKWQSPMYIVSSFSYLIWNYRCQMLKVVVFGRENYKCFHFLFPLYVCLFVCSIPSTINMYYFCNQKGQILKNGQGRRAGKKSSLHFCQVLLISVVGEKWQNQIGKCQKLHHGLSSLPTAAPESPSALCLSFLSCPSLGLWFSPVRFTEVSSICASYPSASTEQQASPLSCLPLIPLSKSVSSKRFSWVCLIILC